MHCGSTVCGIFQEYNAHELQGFVVVVVVVVACYMCGVYQLMYLS